MRSVAYNLVKLPVYINSINYIRQRIEASGADRVINFYELLTGLTYFLFRPSVPQICIRTSIFCSCIKVLNFRRLIK